MPRQQRWTIAVLIAACWMVSSYVQDRRDNQFDVATIKPRSSRRDAPLGALVVDLTNVSGSFDYRQPVPDQEPKYSGIEHAESFVGVPGDVGLTLKRSREPVEWLVIDGAARPTPD